MDRQLRASERALCEKASHPNLFAELHLIEPHCRIGKGHGGEIKLDLSHRPGFELLPVVMKPSFENRYACRRVAQVLLFEENRADGDAVFRIHSRDDLKICLD